MINDFLRQNEIKLKAFKTYEFKNFVNDLNQNFIRNFNELKKNKDEL